MSVYFDPTINNEYLEISPTNSNLELTGDFTIEFFIKCNMNTSTNPYPIILAGNVTYSTPNTLGIYAYRQEAPGKICLQLPDLGVITGTTDINNNQWHHVAVVRNGMASNNTKLYVDGIMNTQISISYTINYNANIKLLIAKNDPGSPESLTKYQGYLSNFRIVNGTAVYTGNFTPPTTSLTSIPGTALLLFNNPSDLFVDGSPNNFTVTKFTSPNFPTASADSPVTYAPPSPSVPCFKENSKILCLVDGIEKELLVQDIRKGVLVKTLLNGYMPVDMIGTTKLFNPANSERYTDRLYLCSQEMYPELNEDLIITGCHSILVDDFLNQDQRDKTIDVLGNVYITNNKYRLPACVDDRAVPYEKEGTFAIYHIALENENYYSNYGVYANGLLVETCSKRYLKELSNMELL